MKEKFILENLLGKISSYILGAVLVRGFAGRL